ncbi:hypothetical protein AGABI2DRAFT_119352 [Agaricus bisporus var. bisporus H97]|uniref:hypothetical protein n=1 Tax=Agaricus bisporus var. bisporus (strain H97 / ATCC MYA-4626 / FGSC 10389) TaxID=936046 RepID=UPI00029F50C5|nr:hypothetical protein AGABI2DRAFT_119352 [Agaricus bisporus var. bisporus H97]EKV45676.1 hypothetical protein AGABI2DRAFT_119352 [Agaricus bisporus var. bisporus H97]
MPELPFEIWGEIHSYLTPDESKKLIGVNRYFFEAGMDEIYKEIRVYNVDDNRILQQLQDPSIAARVKRINMVCYFLPPCDKDGKPLPQRSPCESECSEFLKTSITALYNCKNLKSLTIFLHHSRAITAPFRNFISNLVSKTGSGLQELSLTMTVQHVRFLEALLTAQSWSPRVNAVKFTILPPYCINESKQVTNHNPPTDVVEAFQRQLLHLFWSTGPSLESLHIFNFDDLDLSSLFSNLGGFSSLKEFSYEGHGRAHSPYFLQTLDGLLEMSPNLKDFSFKALSQSLWPASPPVRYYEDHDWPGVFVNNSFICSLKIPDGLSMCLPKNLSGPVLDAFSSSFCVLCSKSQRILMNTLQSLTYIEFRHLLDWITKVYENQDKGVELVTFELDPVKILSAVHLNEILGKIPSLTNLTIGFFHLSVDPSARVVSSQWKLYFLATSLTLAIQRPSSQSRADFEDEIYKSFRTFAYASSGLKRLKLVRRLKSEGSDIRIRLLESLRIALPKVQGSFEQIII